MTCTLCGFKAFDSQQAHDHMLTDHGAPDGWSYRCDGKDYSTPMATLSIHEIRQLAGRGMDIHHSCFMDGANGELIPLGEANAVDLRTRPSLWFVPPATTHV